MTTNRQKELFSCPYCRTESNSKEEFTEYFEYYLYDINTEKVVRCKKCKLTVSAITENSS